MLKSTELMKQEKLFFTILVVTKNEEAYIGRLLETLINQDFSKDLYEIIIVDGCSSDATIDIVNNYLEKYPSLIKILNNPKQTLPPGWNKGIKEALGQYILRIDGHTEVKENFLQSYYQAIKKEPNATCVGGIVVSKGNGFQGEVNEYVFSHPFGVGRSMFRILQNAWEGYTTTVPYAAYKKEVFEEVGLFNESLKRNEDIEFHQRVKKMGGSFFLTTSIQSTYYVRDSILGLIKKSMGDGTWSMIANRVTPGSLSLFKLIPLIAFLMANLMIILSFFYSNIFYVLLGCIGLYFLMAFICSLRLVKNKGLRFLVPCIFTFFCLHFSRGLGSFIAFFKKEFWKLDT
ncbi:glycosyltransferase family 2 protein [Alkalihalobacillus trypoxylicola]|uniref:Glycosyl transferase n=1 Tax=Alkalihalobacillus trypoxylicola TaxID=519424 RepID=A0A162DUL7_9BACI|nr:glycosyltransferase family 2 protein [Alkalihalobacillus trypoxylicola]KYG30881.1 glycosyl transferase [Alkalihalobacillus trypoxylicola]